MRWGTLTVLVVWLAAMPQAQAKDLQIEIAADNGAPSSALAKGVKSLSKATEGRVAVKFTAGANDATVVQNLIAGTIDGAVLTSAGLALLAPELRMLDLPFLFPDARAAIFGRDALDAGLTEILANAGYVKLGWTDSGGIHLFSVLEVQSTDDLRATKMGMPVGDPFMLSYLTNLGVSALPVAAGDVQSKFTQGAIDAWHSGAVQASGGPLNGSVKFRSSKPLWITTGAIVMRKDVFDALVAADQGDVRRALADAAELVTAESHRLEKIATKALTKQKVISVDLSKDLLTDMRAAAEKTWRAHAGTDYDVALLNKLLERQGLTQIDPAKVPTRAAVAAMKPAARMTAAAAVQPTSYRGDGEDALNAALADAPEDLRALRLALEDCDADMMVEWIRFPVRVGNVRYKSAGELSKACAAGQAPQLPAAELEAGIRNASLSGTDLRLRVSSQDWRFVWSGSQWWLTEVVSYTSM